MLRVCLGDKHHQHNSTSHQLSSKDVFASLFKLRVYVKDKFCISMCFTVSDADKKITDHSS